MKKRITAVLAITSSGKKFPSLLIFKKQNNVKNPHEKELMIFKNKNGWITEEILSQWLHKTIFNLKLKDN